MLHNVCTLTESLEARREEMASVTKTITETIGEIQKTTSLYFTSFEDFMEYERVVNEKGQQKRQFPTFFCIYRSTKTLPKTDRMTIITFSAPAFS